jgi:hypothetical protein
MLPSTSMARFNILGILWNCSRFRRSGYNLGSWDLFLPLESQSSGYTWSEILTLALLDL